VGLHGVSLGRQKVAGEQIGKSDDVINWRDTKVALQLSAT
jgi:hypothetical protein